LLAAFLIYRVAISSHSSHTIAFAMNGKKMHTWEEWDFPKWIAGFLVQIIETTVTYHVMSGS
jgi:hypothetical protein